MENRNELITWPGWETVRVIGRGSIGTVYEIRFYCPGGCYVWTYTLQKN